MPMNTTKAHWTLWRSAPKSAAIWGKATFTEKSRAARYIASPAVAPARMPRQRPPPVAAPGPPSGAALRAGKGAARGAAAAALGVLGAMCRRVVHGWDFTLWGKGAGRRVTGCWAGVVEWAGVVGGV